MNKTDKLFLNIKPNNMIAISLADFCHKELKNWSSMLIFYEIEMDGFKKRLMDISIHNTNPQVLKQVEHFQNQFIVQKENFDILNHEIKVHEQSISKEIQGKDFFDNLEITDQQYALRERMHMQEKIFISLKHEFYNFAGRVM